MNRALPILLSILAMCSAGCSAVPPACDAMCDDALFVYEVCMEGWDQQWGEAVGYTGQDDYLNWCSTFVMEQQELAFARRGASGSTEVKQTCKDQRVMLAFGYCDDYLDSWELWDEFTRPVE